MADKKYGSTRRGIAPAYADKYRKKAIRTGDLFDMAALKEKVFSLVEYNNLMITGVYHAEPIDPMEIYRWLEEYGGFFREYIVDTGVYLHEQLQKKKRVMFEAQLGALRDIDFGIYPYTSSSSTLAAYAPIGAGIPGVKVDHTIGIMKAYSSCVGEGPFTVEMRGAEAEMLRGVGGEFGAATGRPRRVGAFDAVASRYGVRVQGADELALTKLDILSYLDKIPVCIAYDIDGKQTTEFPTGTALDHAKPVFDYLDGWKCDISGCRKESELPQAALDYIRFCEAAVGCKLRYVSVGAERDAYIRLD